MRLLCSREGLEGGSCREGWTRVGIMHGTGRICSSPPLLSFPPLTSPISPALTVATIKRRFVRLPSTWDPQCSILKANTQELLEHTQNISKPIHRCFKAHPISLCSKDNSIDLMQYNGFSNDGVCTYYTVKCDIVDMWYIWMNQWRLCPAAGAECRLIMWTVSPSRCRKSWNLNCDSALTLISVEEKTQTVKATFCDSPSGEGGAALTVKT